MNTPNPLIPQGMLPENRGKSHVRIAVLTILAIHVVLLGALLLQGCKKTAEPTTEQPNTTSTYPPLPADTSTPPLPPSNIVQPPVDNTNPPAPVQEPVVTTSPSIPPAETVITPPPGPSANVGGPGSEHVITKGETFAVLAKKYGVSTKAIVAANPGVDPTRLKIGQKVVIPAAGPAAAAPNSLNGGGAPADSGNGNTYAVKSGDTLTKIARQHGISVKELRSANRLKTDRISVGQKLKIPAKSNGGSAPAGAPPSGPGSPMP